MTEKPRKPLSRYTLTEPCADCPFRSDKPFHLHPSRVESIAESLAAGSEFYCHKTLEYGADDDADERLEDETEPFDVGPHVVARTRACAGAAITLERGGDRPTQLRQISERLGIPVAPLDMGAPVYGSLEEWRDRMIEGPRASGWTGS